MRRTILLSASLFLAATFAGWPSAAADVIRGGAVLGSVSSTVKISRKINGLRDIEKGDILYVVTEQVEPVSQVTVKDVFSDEIYSEPLPQTVARQIRETRAILIFSNVLEYGEFIKATIEGTEEAFRDFVDRNPKTDLREEAERIADGIVYRPFKIKGTLAAFEEFLRKHPGNHYARNARDRRDYLIYLTYQSTDRLSAYREFVRQYPDNRYIGEARERISEILARFEEVGVEHLARAAATLVGKEVKFFCYLHSVLPVYVEGTSVGRKTESFTSPRASTEYLNFQVDSGDFVLWRLFIDREDADLVRRIQVSERGSLLNVYGQVFSAKGNAPWVDVYDVEVNR
jgi:hypothetical protein